MPSQVLIVDGSFGPGYSGTFTVPEDVTSGVITCLSAVLGVDEAVNVLVDLNGDFVAGLSLATTAAIQSTLLRIGLVAGDVVKLYASGASTAAQLTGNLSKS